MEVLIACATKNGSTRQVAEAIAETMRGQGHGPCSSAGPAEVGRHPRLDGLAPRSSLLAARQPGTPAER